MATSEAEGPFGGALGLSTDHAARLPPCTERDLEILEQLAPFVGDGREFSMDEQVARLSRALREHAAPPGTSLQELREQFADAMRRSPVAPGVVTTRHEVERRAVEWHVPAGRQPARTILYLHGGGYTMGSLDTIRPMVSHLVEATGFAVLTVEYRLAPEHPYPAGLEDAVAVYTALLTDGIAPESLVVAGDSAGGGLALAALVEMREREIPLPAAGILISPFADLTLTLPSVDANEALDPQLQRWSLAEMAAAYAGSLPLASPQISPARADLQGLSPLLIQVGALEMLLDDSRRIAQAADAAGTPVTLEVWPDMIHVWHAFAPRLQAGLKGLAAIARWLDDRFASASV